MKRELEIWRRLDHPNIVPLLGTASGEDFGCDYPCMVSVWMPHGTLVEYVKHCGNELLLPSRIRLVSIRDSGTVIQFTMMLQITGSAAGLECRGFTNTGFRGCYITSSSSTFETNRSWSITPCGLYHLTMMPIRPIYPL